MISTIDVVGILHQKNEGDQMIREMNQSMVLLIYATCHAYIG